MVATARLPKPRKPAPLSHRTIRLTERSQLGERRVDAEAGIIFDVKILGHQSDNKRIYTPEAMKAAIPLYEGRFVNIDHPDKPLAQRSSLDRTAWLESVRYVEGDGLRGNLHFLLPLDDYQKKVIWAAEHKPNAWGLSHNADGKGAEDRQGRFVVEAITEVRSVDLVPEPATNRSLFESQTMQTTLRQLIESDTVRKALFAKHLLEMPDEYADAPMDMPVEPAPAETGDWKADLVAAIGKLVSSEDEADHKMAQKIMGMLKPGAAAPPAETATEGEGEEKEDKDKDKDKKDKPMESAKPTPPAPGTITLTEEKAKRLCKLANVSADAELLEAMQGGNEETAMKLLEWAQKKATPPARSSTPRSQGPGAFDPAGDEEARYRQAVQRLTGREVAASK